VKDLGLIIVDEEHEHTYKQEETPRYNARDVAVMRGHMEKCPVILGSATPSLESLWNARKGKYRMIKMAARVDHQRMPMMHIVDMREEMGREGRLNVLSRDLVGAVNDRLARGEQVMLFLNRRGFASSMTCPTCGEAATCPQCGVPFTYHRATNRLLCHYCALEQTVPQACPNKDCRDPQFRFGGMGTQRVEDVIQKCFPRATIQRMDSDTMTRKDAYREALAGFRTGKVDILIGTQMIAKGLHFPNVTLVGVINADIGLHAPDFRAGEKTFQILTQVAGRAGRGDVAGEVFVQTFTPFHPAIQAARRLDYDGFIDQEIEFRRELGYPPCGHLVCMHLRGPVEERTKLAAETYFRRLQPLFGPEVVAAAPTPSPIARIRNEFRYQIVFRAPRTADITGPMKAALKGFSWPADIVWSIDVDALSLL
jgi:primosomal protein N' (replication factor Y)